MFVERGGLDSVQLRALCDRSYNNRALVPDHPAVLTRWLAEAQAFRATASSSGLADLDVAYVDRRAGGTSRTLLDLFWPASADRDSCPIAMFIHGGYWQGGDRTAVSHFARGANEAGIAVAIPSYDLCPDATIGVIIEQIAAACVWLWRRYRRRIAACGHSAGGHLAAVMLAEDFSRRHGEVPSRLVPCAMPISGLFDLRDLVYAQSVNSQLDLDIAGATAWSPLLSMKAPAGAVAQVVVGAAESDAFLWQSHTLVDRWKAAGVDMSLSTPDGNHFTVLDSLARPHSDLAERLRSLSTRALGWRGPH